MEGVDASPQSNGCAPCTANPWSTCNKSAGAETRESCPTPIFNSLAGLPGQIDLLPLNALHSDAAHIAAVLQLQHQFL